MARSSSRQSTATTAGAVFSSTSAGLSALPSCSSVQRARLANVHNASKPGTRQQATLSPGPTSQCGPGILRYQPAYFRLIVYPYYVLRLQVAESAGTALPKNQESIREGPKLTSSRWQVKQQVKRRRLDALHAQEHSDLGSVAHLVNHDVPEQAIHSEPVGWRVVHNHDPS